MIIDKKKYISFLGLLSVCGIFISNYTYSNIEKSNKNFSSFLTSNMNYTSYSYKVDFKNFENSGNDVDSKINSKTFMVDEYIKIIKDESPYPFKEYVMEEYDDEFGKTLNINAYLELPDSVDDLLLIEKSDIVTLKISSLNSSNRLITVTYL
ncbi:hypothetical protein [Aliarcobacter butzleri]|uniref:hypothetical protein n=1 Tax=Aliarcobacter butzleri TaxID=28197 RepID=UPI002B250611|nr:hypothetical protein [Aliarcobacter butzleri]